MDVAGVVPRKMHPLLHKPYPSDVTDDEWTFVAPRLTLTNPDAPRCVDDVRVVFNAVRWLVRAGAPRGYLPMDFPPWEAVYQQTQRWLRAGACDEMVNDLRVLLRRVQGRADKPTATIFDSRALQCPPDRRHREGDDGHERKQGTKRHAVVDTLGDRLALPVTAANEQDRARVAPLAP